MKLEQCYPKYGTVCVDIKTFKSIYYVIFESHLMLH